MAAARGLIPLAARRERAAATCLACWRCASLPPVGGPLWLANVIALNVATTMIEPIASPAPKEKERDKEKAVRLQAGRRKKLLALPLDGVSIAPLLTKLFQRLPYSPVDKPDQPAQPVLLLLDEPGRTKTTSMSVDTLATYAKVAPDDRLPFLWADVTTDQAPLMQALADSFGVPEMAIPFSDIPLERLESYQDYLLITIREESTGYGETPQELKIFIIRQQWIVTLHAKPLLTVSGALRAITELSQPVHKPTVALFALLFEACTSTEPNVDRIYAELRALEELVLIFSGGEESDLLLRIANARSRIAAVNMSALSKTTLLKDLHALKDLLSLDTRYFLEELAMVQQQLNTRLGLAANVLSNQASTYLSRVSLHVAVNSESVNQVMKKLNAISTIMLPLLAIQGIFSMNVKVPGRDVDNLNWFWSLCAVFVLSTVILWYGLKRLGWW